MAWRVRPSQAAVWAFCAGSVPMQERYSGESGPAAAEGTAAHWVLSSMIAGNPQRAGALAENGVIVSEDMIDGATMAYNVIAAWGVPVVSERALPAEWIHETEAGGTPDVWAYDREQLLIRVLDFKYGFGIVEPFENWQLLVYLAAIMQYLGIGSGLDDESHTVEFTIVQPRASHPDGPVRTWRFKASDMRAQFNILRRQAAEAVSDNPACISGPHCENCDARHACETLQRSAYRAASFTGQADPFELSPVAASRELMVLEDAKALLDARISGLQVQVMSDIRKGSVSQHFDIEQKTARRTWQEGMEEVAIGLAAASGKNIIKPRRAVTPTQAMKELGEDVVKSLSYKPVGEAKLVRRDVAKFRKLFGA